MMLDRERLNDFLACVRGRTIFVTGITGFLGKGLLDFVSQIPKDLLDLEIIGLSRNPDAFYLKYPAFKQLKCLSLLKGDLSDSVSQTNWPTADFFVHGSAITDLKDIVNDPSKILKEARDGIRGALDIFERINAKKFLFMSSGAVYQPLSQVSERCFREEDALLTPDQFGPASAYGVAKLESERYCREYFATQTSSYLIARCFSFVGPYFPNQSHYAIAQFIERAAANQDIDILSDGMALRSYLHTHDLWYSVMKLLQSNLDVNIFNVGSDAAITIRETAELVQRVVSPSIHIKIHGRAGVVATAPNVYVPSLARLREKTGWAPRISLEKAIASCADWYRNKKQN